MSVLVLMLILALLGLAAWAITAFVPMPQGIKNLIVIVAVIAGIMYTLNAFGVWGTLPAMQVPRIR